VSRLVVALGGNALLRRDERADAATQRRHAVAAATSLAAAADEHELVVTHGNGPQVGLLALEAEAYEAVPPYPLDVLGAETQGMVGYVLAQALANAGARTVAAVLTQVVVDADDPAFTLPSKPIGPVYDEPTARLLAASRGWSVAPDGEAFRRVVASPEPREVVELPAIERLLESGLVVICAGGGGIPVVRDGTRILGVEAVIDKDRTAALLAESLAADRLAILTDVSRVERNWRTSDAAPIETATPRALRRLSFAAGSMAPKVDAACTFVERTGRPAVIGALDELTEVIAGAAGTRIEPDRVCLAEPRSCNERAERLELAL
jgi:carbamate kinase